MRTSFHHQSEAQHPKSSAIHKYAGRLPHLRVMSRHRARPRHVRYSLKADIHQRGLHVRFVPQADVVHTPITIRCRALVGRLGVVRRRVQLLIVNWQLPPQSL